MGTALRVLICSRSISFNASSTSHLYISTNFPPPTVPPCITQLLAVTWNKGVATNDVGGGAETGASTDPSLFSA